jgi:hypothetical protein
MRLRQIFAALLLLTSHIFAMVFLLVTPSFWFVWLKPSANTRFHHCANGKALTAGLKTDVQSAESVSRK